MNTIVVVHGIGGGSTADTKNYSAALKKNVLKKPEDQSQWIEAPWEGVNDTLDANFKRLIKDAWPRCEIGKRFENPKTLKGTVLNNVCKGLRYLCNRTPDILAKIIDYLLDLPLYIGEKRGHAIRDIVLSHIRNKENVILVGHSLGSLICYDILCEYKSKNEELPVKALVTLGSPIEWVKGVDEKQFTPIQPIPLEINWVNMFYENDPVCRGKGLAPSRFSDVENIPLSGKKYGFKAHTAYWNDQAVADEIRKLAYD